MAVVTAGDWDVIGRENAQERLGTSVVTGREQMLTEAELMALSGAPATILRKWRRYGLGPVPARVGKHVRYLPRDVVVWVLGDQEAPMTAPTRPGREQLMTIEQLAEMLQLPPSTVRRWRRYGTGPCGVRVGKYVRYRPADVGAWLDQQREVR